MPRQNLSFSKQYSLYTLSVGFHTSGNVVSGTAIIDSGSAGTSITENVASELEIIPSQLKRMIISGVTGIDSKPMLEKIDIVLFVGTKVVPLENVTILENFQRERKRKQQGIRVGTDIQSVALPNLLGLDFLKKLNATFVMSVSKNEAYIEW